MLTFLDFTKPFKIYIDANYFTIEGVFMQDGHLIVFENKKLYGVQVRWSIHKNELYVMVCCLKTWQHYLGMHKTNVFTNNISLRYFETQPRASTKQLRWMTPWHCWMWNWFTSQVFIWAFMKHKLCNVWQSICHLLCECLHNLFILYKISCIRSAFSSGKLPIIPIAMMGNMWLP
jgi:hypothetical protein